MLLRLGYFILGALLATAIVPLLLGVYNFNCGK